MRTSVLSAAVFALSLAVAGSAYAGMTDFWDDDEALPNSCRIGAVKSVKGTIHKRMPDGGDTWIELYDHTTPCELFGVAITKGQAPSNCKAGSTIRVRGKVHFYEYGPYIRAGSISCSG